MVEKDYRFDAEDGAKTLPRAVRRPLPVCSSSSVRPDTRFSMASGRLDLNQRALGPQPSALLADTRCFQVR